MILRDPVHGLVAFEGDDERVVRPLLAAREVQRLRRVRQLGLASLVFPGAEHSRFAHALGAAWLMVRLRERIRACEGDLPREARLTDEDARDALAAALLHDLGHGPYSHLFEDVLPDAPRHEAWTCAILRHPETDVHRALEAISEGMSARVAALLEGAHPTGHLARAVSGALDVDRLDYLLRDAHATGVRFGFHDVDWVLRAIALAPAPRAGDGLVLAVEGRKGLPPFEAFFLGRHFMYQQVYHHKATRAAELLVRAIFHRVAELARDGRPPDGLPRALARAVAGGVPDVLEYLRLDDETIGAAIDRWQESADPLLARLSSDLRRRVLPKTVPLPPGPEAAARRAAVLDEARAVAHAHGVRADLLVRVDEATHVAYAEPEGDGPDGLWVRIRHRPLARLGEVSFLLRELRNKSSGAPRLLFPGELRPLMVRVVERSFA